MFNINNKEKVMDLVNRRGKHILMPLYVSIGNLRYGLLEIDQIRNVTSNSFKVGFGCVNTVFSKTPIFKCQNLLQYFQNVTSFHQFDYDEGMDYIYYTFECNINTSNLLMNEFSNNDEVINVLNEINIYNESLFNYVTKSVEEYRKNCIDKFNQENEDE